MNRRLAIFIPSLGGGGAERVMVFLANGFSERGFSVDLVLSRAEGPYMQELAAKVRVVDLASSRVLLSLPKLVAYLRRERPGAMLSALHYANIVAILANMISCTNTHLVVSERANLSVSQRNARGLKQKLIPCLMRLTYPRADAILANSHGVADDLAANLNLDGENIEIIYNPVSLEKIAQLSNEQVHHHWYSTKVPPVLIAVGRFTEQKGFDVLIRAFHEARRSQALRLVILGDGPLRSKYEELIETLGLAEDVLMPGFMKNPFSWVSRSRLFVFSSAWEGCPNALLEALACGTPVVSTDCPSGPMEILENGRWGRLIPVGDVAAMAAAIREALDENQPPDVVRRAADFDVESTVDRYLLALGALD